jgi:hypothetical protein
MIGNVKITFQSYYSSRHQVKRLISELKAKEEKNGKT